MTGSFVSVDGKCSVAQGGSQRQRDSVKLGSCMGTNAFNYSSFGFVVVPERSASENPVILLLRRDSKKPGVRNFWLSAHLLPQTLKGNIYSAFERNWMKYGQIVLPVNLGGLIISCLAHSGLKFILHLLPFCSVPCKADICKWCFLDYLTSNFCLGLANKTTTACGK